MVAGIGPMNGMGGFCALHLVRTPGHLLPLNFDLACFIEEDTKR